MNKLASSHLFIVTLSLVLVSCSPLQKPDINNTAPFFAKEAASAVNTSLLPVAPPDIKPSKYREDRTLNVSVHDIDAREFFLGLVIDTKDNILVHPDVSGRISLELKNVNVPLVLEAVQKVYGYDYKKTELGYIVYPATLQTKTFKIDRLDLLREGKSITYVSSGQTTNSGTTGQQNYGQNGYQQSTNNQQQGGSNQMNAMSSRTSGSTVTTTTKADFWQDLETALTTLIAADKEATVVINRQAGVIIARAKPIQLHEIESFLATTQNQISRQVILETKILEVVLNSSHQNGPRVEGHIWIAILAYHLLCWIQETLRESGDNRRWGTIRRVLQTHCYTTIVVPTKGGKTYRMRKAGEPEELQKSIYQKLDVKWDRLPETKLEVETEAIL